MKREDFLIEAEDLLKRLGQTNLRIFDATIAFYIGLSPEEAAKMPTAYQMYLAGHIPGAAFFEHLEFSDAESRYEYMLAADEVLEDQIGKIGITNDSEVIVYTPGILACATRAWWLLRYAGVENVCVLNGGLEAWQKAGGLVETTDEKYPPARFKAKFSPAMLASKEEVLSTLGKSTAYVENALTVDWYNQEHIPGSVCLPLTELTEEWAAFLPDDQMASKLKDIPPNQRIITYCGGGIAATVNAMAYLMAEHTNVAIYDGSLFEWKGEALPIAKSR